MEYGNLVDMRLPFHFISLLVFSAKRRSSPPPARADCAIPSRHASAAPSIRPTMSKRTDVICLFDVDGTLTVPRKPAEESTYAFLAKLREKVLTGVVGGSDLQKQHEQLGADCLDKFDFFFPENGLAAYKAGQLIKKTSIKVCSHACCSVTPRLASA